MKASYFSLFAALLLFNGTSAQQICKRLSFYFDTDKSELKPASVTRLDSILLACAGRQYLAELYGHTDTVGRDAYNNRLAMERMKSIETYLDGKAPGMFDYKEKNFPETNIKVSRNTEANLAFNRRVDLYILPVQNGMLTLKGKNPSENIQVPADYFEPCGLCANQPQFKSYYNENDTKGTNITFQTSDGYNLQTAGTMMLDYTPCNGVKRKDTAAVVFRICDGKPDDKMTLWQADTVNGKIVWKPSANKFVLDPASGCYIFRAPAGKLYNLDKIRYDTIFSLEMPDGFAYYHVIVRDKKNIRYNTEGDSIRISRNDTSCMVHGFAQKDDRVFLMSVPISALPDTIKREGRNYSKEFNSTLAFYEELTYNDTVLKVRSARKMRNVSYGFYLPEYKEFIPMDSSGGKYALNRKPNCNYQLGFVQGKRLYVISNRNIKPKYSADTNTELFKLTRKTRKKFRRVPDYSPKSGNKGNKKQK